MTKPNTVFLPSLCDSRRRKPFLLKPRKSSLTMTVNKKDLNQRITLLHILHHKIVPFQTSKRGIFVASKSNNETLPSSNHIPPSLRDKEDGHNSDSSAIVLPESVYLTPMQEQRVVPSSPPSIRRVCHTLPVWDMQGSSNIPEHLLLPLLT